MEAVCFSRTLVPAYESTWWQNPEEHRYYHHHPHHCDSLKSHMVRLWSWMVNKLLNQGDCVLFEGTLLAFTWRQLGKPWTVILMKYFVSHIFSEYSHYIFVLQRGVGEPVQCFFEICVNSEWSYQMAPLSGTY